LKKEMTTLAENLEFEKAQDLKEKLRAFEDYQGKSTVVSTTICDVDVFAIATDEKMAYAKRIDRICQKIETDLKAFAAREDF